MTTLLCLLLLSLGRTDPGLWVQPHPLDGTWEGILTQEEGGYRPEYRMRLVLRVQGRKVTGFCEVDQGDDVYIKTEVSGTLTKGFFLDLKDGLVINRKDLVDEEYCVKSYQLVYLPGDKKALLKGRWQGTAGSGACIPGAVILRRSSDRA